MADKVIDTATGHNALLVDMGDGTFAIRILAAPPFNLLTDFDGAGDHPRLRTDEANTAFFAGRGFRTFERVTSLANGSTHTIKIVSTIDFILWDLSVNVITGDFDIKTWGGAATPGGTFSTTLPIFNRNLMSSAPVVATGLTITSGGTVTGGTQLDDVPIRTGASGLSAKNPSAGSEKDAERGLPPGTYYVTITNVGNAAGSFVAKARWEERPVGV